MRVIYQNRLVEVKRSSDNTTIATYTYDLLGRRTKKVDSSRSTNASETILYTYSNENTIAEEKTIRTTTNTGGTISLILNKTYINGLGTDNLLAYDTDERTISDYNLGKLNFCDSRVFPYESEFIGYAYTGITTDCSNLLVTSSGTSHNRYYVHTNHQGSVIALTSSTGVVVQQYAYDSFGVPYVKSGTGSSTIYVLVSSYTGTLHENSRLYTSREYDREVLLYFNRARYYSPSTGKFISRDPIGQNDQINLYTYVGNSPVMYVDLRGREKQIILVISFFGEGDNGDTSFWEELGLSKNLNARIVNKFAKDRESYNAILKEYQKNNVTDLIIAGHGNAGAMKFGSDKSSIYTLESDYAEVAKIDSLKYVTLASCYVGKAGGETFTTLEDGTKYKYPMPEGVSYASEVSDYLVKSGKNIELFAPDGYFYPNLGRVGLFDGGNILTFPSRDIYKHFNGISNLLIPETY